MAANTDLPPGVDKEQVFGMLAMEMEYKVELFNRSLCDHWQEYVKSLRLPFRLAMGCFNKCVDKRYKEPELTMGENSCIDRCVSKYFLH
ncbi:mitochondrial import inner membrane translocase subunit TIM10 isoform X2 [Manihot esculenta]|uniref:mitochondrial import inner membrane translocase subunit TIM10 isoform X2 n=1 Tax=Manihot esculenta TaxID=3983 RepID=UPI001CC79479|nr:mitochondrial import inner membrane translocase subunit TIM10 isoform X2 [Manihot esculenta]